jgi:threonine aldolase
MECAVDFRSDTVTVPDARMRAVIANAAVGDDFYGEDPTVRELERRAAELVGTEAALFVVGGTMANLVALLALTSPGGQVLAHAESDLMCWEAHSACALAGVQVVPLPGPGGVLDLTATERALAADDWRAPRPAAVVIENTHSASGGSVWPQPAIDVVGELAAAAGIPLICDGARLFNATVAGGYRPADVSRWCAAVTISLYKGLGAPMGSLVCCSAEVRARAAAARRLLGTTFRQIGMMAAAGLLALDNIGRLAEDHQQAAMLYAGLEPLFPAEVFTGPPQTNIVTLRLGSAASSFVSSCREQGVLITEVVPGVARFVTHQGIHDDDVTRAVSAAAVAAGERFAVRAR